MGKELAGWPHSKSYIKVIVIFNDSMSKCNPLKVEFLQGPHWDQLLFNVFISEMDIFGGIGGIFDT